MPLLEFHLSDDVGFLAFLDSVKITWNILDLIIFISQMAGVYRRYDRQFVFSRIRFGKNPMYFFEMSVGNCPFKHAQCDFVTQNQRKSRYALVETCTLFCHEVSSG